jgi:hypothetical protein
MQPQSTLSRNQYKSITSLNSIKHNLKYFYQRLFYAFFFFLFNQKKELWISRLQTDFLHRHHSTTTVFNVENVLNLQLILTTTTTEISQPYIEINNYRIYLKKL